MPSRTGNLGGGVTDPYAVDEYGNPLPPPAQAAPAPVADPYIPSSTYDPALSPSAYQSASAPAPAPAPVPVSDPYAYGSGGGGAPTPNALAQADVQGYGMGAQPGWTHAQPAVKVLRDAQGQPLIPPGPPPAPGQYDVNATASDQFSAWRAGQRQTGPLRGTLEDRPTARTDLRGALLGGLSHLASYTVGGNNLLGDLAYAYMPYDLLQQHGGFEAALAAQQRLPEGLAAANTIGRMAWFDDPALGSIAPAQQPAIDQTDAYMGADPEYLARMAMLPEYMQPFRPLIARAAHVITALPGPSWSPPYYPGMDPREDDYRDLAGYGTTPPTWTQEPGVYYDDPYIPGPDHGRRRRG
jgi:hypothetical protein